MTCIVGYIKDGSIYLAGDSFGGHSEWKNLELKPKIFERGVPFQMESEPMLIGFTSSFRFGNLLEFELEIPEYDKDEYKDEFEYMVRAFIPALRSCLTSGGFAKNENGTESGGICLVGFMGRLFAVWDDYQVTESYRPFAAIGSGYQYALGALDSIYTVSKNPDYDYDMMQLGLDVIETASRHSPTVTLPAHVIFCDGDSGLVTRAKREKPNRL